MSFRWTTHCNVCIGNESSPPNILTPLLFYNRVFHASYSTTPATPGVTMQAHDSGFRYYEICNTKNAHTKMAIP